MVGALDESVGEVVAALEEKGILDNTIIVFSTDNGGAANGYDGSRGSNWPLRSVWNILCSILNQSNFICIFQTKGFYHEGGIRGVGFIWSGRIRKPKSVYNFLFSLEDWLPTLVGAIERTEEDPERHRRMLVPPILKIFKSLACFR